MQLVYKFLSQQHEEIPMTKLAQQFQAAGIKAPVDNRKGWTFKAQKAYVRNRFNKVKPNPCPIYNHKAEQIVRAIVLNDPFADLTTTGANRGSVHFNMPMGELVPIGVVKGRTAVFNPSTNSALAILGYNGNAVLSWLGGMRRVDELTGEQCEVIVNDGEQIYTTVGVLLLLAKDCVLNREAVLAAYYGDANVTR
jgi:hypothetical protein